MSSRHLSSVQDSTRAEPPAYTSLGTNLLTDGVPVPAAPCDQKRQCALMPSRRNPYLVSAAETSSASMNSPLDFRRWKFESWTPTHPMRFTYAKTSSSVFPPC